MNRRSQPELPKHFCALPSHVGQKQLSAGVYKIGAYRPAPVCKACVDAALAVGVIPKFVAKD